MGPFQCLESEIFSLLVDPLLAVLFGVFLRVPMLLLSWDFSLIFGSQNMAHPFLLVHRLSSCLIFLTSLHFWPSSASNYRLGRNRFLSCDRRFVFKNQIACFPWAWQTADLSQTTVSQHQAACQATQLMRRG